MDRPIKQCPHCGGEILKVAKKCKHCRQWLEEKTDAASEVQNAETIVASEDKSNEPTKIFIYLFVVAAASLIFLFVNSHSSTDEDLSTSDSICYEE